MVKNTNGGNRAKQYARKLSNTTTSKDTFCLSTNNFEKYVQVETLLGGNQLLCITLDNKIIRCIIRKKFRGRNRRDNLIEIGTWLLVGIHDWSPDTADVLYVYSTSDKIRLQNVHSHLNWSIFLSNDHRTTNDVHTIHDKNKVVRQDIVFEEEELHHHTDNERDNMKINKIEEENNKLFTEIINIDDI